jgi:cell division protein FtsB
MIFSAAYFRKWERPAARGIMSRKSDGIPSSASFLWKSLILALALLINVTLVFRLLWGEQSIAAWHGLRAAQGSLAGELRDLDELRAGLSREIRLLRTDDAYVEKMIRQRLNYVRANEILYLFDDGGQEESPWTGAWPDASAE